MIERSSPYNTITGPIPMLTHYYTTRSYERFGWGQPRTAPEYRLLCTKEYEVDDRDDRSMPIAVTAYGQVTCPKCLAILIPKREAELLKMKANLLKGEEYERNKANQQTTSETGRNDTEAVPGDGQSRGPQL